MSTKLILERQLGRTITLRNKIQRTIYADSCGESKEDVLKALDILIKQRTVELEALYEYG